MQVSLLSSFTLCRRAAAVAIALMAAGCGPQYEIDRPGTWQATGVNDYNLRAMVADKRDLTAGASTATDRGNAAARAVNRLYADRRRQLLNVSLSRIAPGGGDSQDSGGGGAPSAPVGGASPGSQQ